MKAPSIVEIVVVAAAVVTTGLLVRPQRSPAPPDDSREVPAWTEISQHMRRIGDNAPSDYKFVVWTDYQCPACKRFEGAVAAVLADLGESVTVHYRYFPLTTIHAQARPAAALAECSFRSGQFEEMHHTLFTTDLSAAPFSPESLVSRATIRDKDQVLDCFNTGKALEVVDEEAAAGKALGVSATPSIQIGDRLYSGGMSPEVLVDRLKKHHRPSD